MDKERIARVFPRKTAATPEDELVWINQPPPLLAMPEVDEVHISVTFTWDRQRAEDLEKQWRAVGVPVKVGGPAYGDRMSPDFVPGRYLKQGYTFTSRGCPNNCWFCSVAKCAKGKIIELPVQDGYNILDDNLLACSDGHIKAVFEMLKRQKQRPVFTGGLEAKILKPWHASALREVKASRMYFAYDTPDDYEPLIEAGKIMRQEGHSILSHSMRCYLLIGYPKDTMETAEKRIIDTVKAGFVPYAMLWRDEKGVVDKDWAKFQCEWCRPAIVGKKVGEIWKGGQR